MQNRAVQFSWIALLVILLSGVVTVLALGTSTGVALGGTASEIGETSPDGTFYAQGGWIRNNSPWPVTITGITVHQDGSGAQPSVYLLDREYPAGLPAPEVPEGEVVEGEELAAAAPIWAQTSATFPHTIEGGGLRYLGFGLRPDLYSVTSFREITVNYSGPFFFSFDKTYGKISAAASSSELPFPLVANDPASSPTSLDEFLTLYRLIFERGNPEEIRMLMGPGATENDAIALSEAQAAYDAAMSFAATNDPDARNKRVVFFLTDPEVDAAAPLRVTWSDFRWRVSTYE